MTGACLARAGFNRKAAYATLAMTLAAEAPDLDTLWSIDGPIAAFQHHRGWTHTFLGLPFEAAFIVGAVWLFHRWRTRNAIPPSRPARARSVGASSTASPSSPCSATSCSTGPTTTASAPSSPSIPAGTPAPSSSSSNPSSSSSCSSPSSPLPLRPHQQRSRRTQTSVPRTRLGHLRSPRHRRPLDIPLLRTPKGPPTRPERRLQRRPRLRVFANPYPINPFHWQTVAETPQFYQLASADTFNNTVTTDQARRHLQAAHHAGHTCRQTQLARRGLPRLVAISCRHRHGTDPDGLTTVTFRDLRFFYDTPLLAGREKSPLSGTSTLTPTAASSAWRWTTASSTN